MEENDESSEGVLVPVEVGVSEGSAGEGVKEKDVRDQQGMALSRLQVRAAGRMRRCVRGTRRMGRKRIPGMHVIPELAPPSPDSCSPSFPFFRPAL